MAQDGLLVWMLFNSIPKCVIHEQGSNSRSASDNIRTIVERTESVPIQKFQHSINDTLPSGEFSKSLAKERETVGTHFASGFIDQ